MRVPEANIRRVLEANLWLKGAHSLLEVLGGHALAFVSHDLILRLCQNKQA